MDVLIIDSRVSVAKEVGSYLNNRGYFTDFAYNLDQGLELFEKGYFDAVVVAANINGGDGCRLVRLLRMTTNWRVSVLMLGCEDGVEHVVRGLESGADAYLNPGHSVIEIEMRIRSLIMRRSRAAHQLFRVGELEYDSLTGLVSRRGRVLKLSPTQLRVLLRLMDAAPSVVSYREFASCVPSNYEIRDESLRSHMYRLRRAVDRNFDYPLIKTHPTHGYSLTVSDVSRRDSESSPSSRSPVPFSALRVARGLAAR